MRRSALLFASLLGYQLVAHPIPEPIPGLPTITASSVTASLEANEGIVAWSASTTVLQTESATERTMWKLGEEKAREFDTKSRNRSWVMPLGPDAASRGV